MVTDATAVFLLELVQKSTVVTWMKKKEEKKKDYRWESEKALSPATVIPGMTLHNSVKSEQILKISKSLCTQGQPKHAHVSLLTIQEIQIKQNDSLK